jgi:hypothetical protein
VVRHIFQACPVWIYTQSNITSIIYIQKGLILIYNIWISVQYLLSFRCFKSNKHIWQCQC